MNLGFIGGGQMAEAIIGAITANQFVDALDVIVGDVSEERRTYLTNKFSVITTASNLEVAEKSDLMLLAIKPQDVPAAAKEIAGSLKPSCTLVSIVAGTTLNTLQDLFQHNVIVRVMPNTPAQVRMGMSVWMPTNNVSASEKTTVVNLLRCLGKEMFRCHNRLRFSESSISSDIGGVTLCNIVNLHLSILSVSVIVFN